MPTPSPGSHGRFIDRNRIMEDIFMRNTTAALFSAAIALALNAPAGAAEREKEISLKDVPAAVRATADKAVPNAKWEKAEQEVENGQPIYELKGKVPDKNREFEVEATPDGKLIQIEVEIDYDEVPDPVRNTLKARYPNFKPKEVKSVTREGEASGYEFEGPGAKGMGKELEVFISGDGQTVNVRED
jgi:hypothetical protein